MGCARHPVWPFGRTPKVWGIIRLSVFISILTLSRGDADPREWLRGPPQALLRMQTPGVREGTPRPHEVLGARIDSAYAEQLQECGVQQNVTGSEWHDMRVQLNRAMGQLQSNAQHGSAKEFARDLNCWLMHLLSQPPVDGTSQERRALLTNLKRISQLHKDNLRLRLQHIVNNPSRARGGDHDDDLQAGMRHAFSQYDVQQWGRTLSPAPASSQVPPEESGVGAPYEALQDLHIEQPQRQSSQAEAAANACASPPASVPRVLPPSRTIGGRSSSRLDEYAFHRRVYSRGHPMRAGNLGTTPLVRPRSRWRLADEAGDGRLQGREGSGVVRALDGAWGGRDSVGGAGAGVEEFSIGGAHEVDVGMLQLQELRELNRQLSKQVSTLANDNIRLKAVLNQPQLSLLEAAVAQLSSRDVATERAVPDIVKAASSWDERNARTGMGGGKSGAGGAGLGLGVLGASGGLCLLEDGSDPSERGLVLASAALLKRVGLRIGQQVRLKLEVACDLHGARVNVTAGAFLGLMVGQGDTGADNATVYLHMDDGQVRQFALSEIETDIRATARGDGRGAAASGYGSGGGREHWSSSCRSSSSSATHLSSYSSSRAERRERSDGGGDGSPGRRRRGNFMMQASRKMMSQDIKV